MFNIKKGIMFVCLCVAVTDQDIQAAIDQGARSVADVTQSLGAGSRCGSCRPTIASMLDRATSQSPSLRRSLPIITARNAA
jgi:bacterioferritin-associated ferredoxin